MMTPSYNQGRLRSTMLLGQRAPKTDMPSSIPEPVGEEATRAEAHLGKDSGNIRLRLSHAEGAGLVGATQLLAP